MAANSPDVSYVVRIILTILNIILHSLVIAVLALLKYNGEQGRRVINLLNMSSIEFLFCLLSLIPNTMKMGNLVMGEAMKDLGYNCVLVNHTFLLTAYYISMVFILYNVCMEVKIMRCSVFDDERKTRILSVIAWIFGAILFIVIMVASYHSRKKRIFVFIFLTYAAVPIFVIYLLGFGVTFAYTFYKLRKSRLSPQHKKTRRKTLFIPTLLSSTYVIFHIFPTIAFVVQLEKENSQNVEKMGQLSRTDLMINVGIFLNSLICLFLESRIKQKLKRMIIKWQERTSLKRRRIERVSISDGISNMFHRVQRHPSTKTDLDSNSASSQQSQRRLTRNFSEPSHPQHLPSLATVQKKRRSSTPSHRIDIQIIPEEQVKKVSLGNVRRNALAFRRNRMCRTSKASYYDGDVDLGMKGRKDWLAVKNKNVAFNLTDKNKVSNIEAWNTEQIKKQPIGTRDVSSETTDEKQYMRRGNDRRLQLQKRLNRFPLKRQNRVHVEGIGASEERDDKELS